MIEYHRDILSLYVKPEQNSLKNIVKRVTWRWSVKDEINYTDIYIDTYFVSTDPNNFVEYQDLTDEIIFSWIDSVEDINNLKNQLNQKLEEIKTPEMVEKKIPWFEQEKYTGEEEYLLVFDDTPTDPTKIWGPMKWNSIRANKGLKERGVHDYEFPADVVMYQKGLLPFDAPVVINDRVKLYKVEYTDQPILDGAFQYHEGLTWVTDSGKAIGTYFVIDRNIEDVKNILRMKLSNESFERQTGGVEIEIDGAIVKMNTDYVGMLNLLQRWSLMGEEDTITHKINDDTWLELSKDKAQFVLNSMQSHISNILNWEKNLFEQLMASETIEEIKNIKV